MDNWNSKPMFANGMNIEHTQIQLYLAILRGILSNKCNEYICYFYPYSGFDCRFCVDVEIYLIEICMIKNSYTPLYIF